MCNVLNRACRQTNVFVKSYQFISQIFTFSRELRLPTYRFYPIKKIAKVDLEAGESLYFVGFPCCAG